MVKFCWLDGSTCATVPVVWPFAWDTAPFAAYPFVLACRSTSKFLRQILHKIPDTRRRPQHCLWERHWGRKAHVWCSTTRGRQNWWSRATSRPLILCHVGGGVPIVFEPARRIKEELPRAGQSRVMLPLRRHLFSPISPRPVLLRPLLLRARLSQVICED